MEDLDGQILAALAENLLLLLAEDLARSMVGVDDAVADLELDVLRGHYRLEIIQLLFH
jgi:hypothetical protein